MNKADIFDLYADYLISSFSYATAMGLFAILDDAVSHDQVTRFLSSGRAHVKITLESAE